MKRLTVFFGVFIGMMLMAGCASVKFYSDPVLKNETGLRFYTTKPYLLVEYQAEKDFTVKTTVVYLPDLVAPQYMMLRPGLGSNDLKMSFVNGALETYGLVTESKLPEALEAFAAILSKSAYATQAFTGPRPTAPGDGPVFKLYEIVIGQGGTVLKEVIPAEQKSQTPLP